MAERFWWRAHGERRRHLVDPVEPEADEGKPVAELRPGDRVFWDEPTGHGMPLEQPVEGTIVHFEDEFVTCKPKGGGSVLVPYEALRTTREGRRSRRPAPPRGGGF